MYALSAELVAELRQRLVALEIDLTKAIQDVIKLIQLSEKL